MKNTLLLLFAIIAISTSLTAQTDSKTFKPTGGNSAFEVTFDPSAIFNAGNSSPTFALPGVGGVNQGIKYRNWLNENTVTRGTILLGFISSTTPTVLTNSNGDQVDAKDTRFEWALQFRPGVEKHFAGTKRLSPYVGAELILGFGSNKYTSESLDANDAIQESYIKNGTQDFNGNYLYWRYRNGFSIGASLFAGFDYYVAKNLYLGLEINYAFIYNKRFSVATKTAGNDEITTNGGSNWYFNPASGANLRLGWVF